MIPSVFKETEIKTFKVGIIVRCACFFVQLNVVVPVLILLRRLQEINVMIDSAAVCKEWADGIRSNQVSSLACTNLLFPCLSLT